MFDIDPVAAVARDVADAAFALIYLLINPILTISYYLHLFSYYILLHYILTLYTTVGWYVCYLVRSSDIPLSQSAARFVPLPSLVDFSFLGRLPVGDRVTKLACHRSAPEEKPEATIGKWGDWNSLFGAVSRRGQGDAV